MKCECGGISTILKENEDGTITPMCEGCYYNAQFEILCPACGTKHIEGVMCPASLGKR